MRRMVDVVGFKNVDFAMGDIGMEVVVVA